VKKIMQGELIHIGDLIKKKLAGQERSVAWLAGKIGVHRTTLMRILQKHSMDSELLYRISMELEMDYHALYSQKMKKHAAKMQHADAITQH
jgi:plasmid maintenance system antidote protein VapI